MAAEDAQKSSKIAYHAARLVRCARNAIMDIMLIMVDVINV